MPFLSFERNPGRGHGHWTLVATTPAVGLDSDHVEDLNASADSLGAPGP
ncbi:MAG TPA: hypothetical protein VNA28_00135 [Solirubrobacteraceae bacterium]|nr:hypothetical protein [Solirubrobacteraceae bacterium]